MPTSNAQHKSTDPSCRYKKIYYRKYHRKSPARITLAGDFYLIISPISTKHASVWLLLTG